MSRKGPAGLRVPGNVKWLILLASFSAIGYGYIITAITAYLPEQGVSSTDVGLIIGASGLAMIVCAIPFGILSDRIGRKWILIVGLVGVPAAMLLCALSLDPVYFLVASIVSGIAEGALLSTWNAMIADQTTVDNRDLAFSMSFIVNGCFYAIGLALPMLFPTIQDLTGLSSVQVHSGAFVVLTFVTAISPISLVFLLKDYKDKTPGAKLRRGTLLKERSKRTLVKFSINNTLIGLGAGLIIPLVPTWFFLRYGVPDSESGPLLALSSLSIAFAALLSSRLSHRFGQVKGIVITQALSTLFMAAIPIMPGAALAGLMFLIRSALMNMAWPIFDSYMMGIVDKEDRGLASAINSIVWRVPNSVTTFVGGSLLAAGFLTLPFFLAAGIYIVAITAFYINFRNVRPYEEDRSPAPPPA